MKKLSVVHENGKVKASLDHQEEVLRTFKRKTLRTGILGQKSSATRAQEERDLLRALSEFPPQALNAFDDTFALLDGGVGVAVSAAMARRAALYSKNEQVVGFQLSDADAKQGTTKKDFQGSEPFLEEVVNQLVKPKKIRVKADGITKQGKMPVLPRRPSEDRRRLSGTDALNDAQLRDWAKSWLQPAGMSEICKDFGRFQERVTHRFRCWHAGQAGNGFVPLPVLPPVPPTAAPKLQRNGNSRRLVPAKWLKPDSGTVTSSSTQVRSPTLDFLRQSMEDEAEPELAHSPVSVKDMTMSSSIMSSYSSCNRSQPHGIFREASWEESVYSEKPLPLLRCPPEFQEPHRMPNCDTFTSSPEFLYLRVCELSGQLPCSEAWLHFGNGWGIIDASNRSLGDGDLQALVRTAMICKAHGHPLRELNLGGNKLTDAGLKEVLALLRQDCEVQHAGSPREEGSPRVSSMLESLSIACNSQLYFRDRLLVESLPRSIASLTSLTALDISFAPLNGKVAISLAKALAESCRTLRSLSLAGCGLGSCGQADCVAIAALLGRAAAEAGFPGLERADLSGNFFGAAGFLAAAVAIGDCRLRWLTLASNGNPPSEGSDKVEIPFCRHFLRMSDGETEKEREALALHSRQNPLQLFLEGLLVNDTLEELDLSNCGVGIDTAWVLQEALAGHTKLQTLRLCENPLGEAGLRHILRLLTEMGDVAGIDLFGHREADIRCPPVKYRHAHPAGNYKLDMSLVADRAILRTLLRHVGSKYSDAPQRHLRFDPKSARPTERDPRGFWLVPCFGTCNVMYMPPLSEASHRRAKEAEVEQLREAETSEGGPRRSFQARGSFVGSNGRLGSFDSGDDVYAPRKSRVRVSPMSYGTGHHGSLSMSFEGLLPMTKEKTQVEEKPQIQPGLAGTPEGDWIEVHELLQDCRVKDPQFPSKSRTLFFSGKRLKELEDGTSKVRPLQPLSPFAKWDESRLDFTEREMANEVLKGLKADQFGLKEHEFKVMVQRAVTMLSALKYCTVSLMVIESLKHFARLGGALFLAEKMSSDHVVEIMKFVGLSLDSAESDLIAVADTAQAGWSNLRRGDYQSNWSNTSPVDNVRAALHVKTDMVKMARDARETVKLVQAEATKAEKVEASDVEEKLESELKFHLQLWQLISKHFEKTARKGEEKQQAFSAASGEPGEDPNDKAKLQVTIEI